MNDKIIVFELISLHLLSHKDILSLSQTCKKIYDIFYKKYFKFPIIVKKVNIFSDNNGEYVPSIITTTTARIKRRIILKKSSVIYNTFDQHPSETFTNNSLAPSGSDYLNGDYVQYNLIGGGMLFYGEVINSSEHFYVEDYIVTDRTRYCEIKLRESICCGDPPRDWIGFATDHNDILRRVLFACASGVIPFAVEIRTKSDGVLFENNPISPGKYIQVNTRIYQITLGYYETIPFCKADLN